jgi:glycosyltransferase involved in cell wall biosynthesis
VRIADSLGALVMQHNRTDISGRYRPPGRIRGVERVILIRDSRGLPQVREMFPDARIYLWVHHHFPRGSKLFRRLAGTARHLRDMRVNIICVSHQQQQQLESVLRLLDLRGRVSMRTIYNPVDDSLLPDGSPVDERKLVFLSSPNKGLKFTLDAFRELHRRMPDLRLIVGNPGYKIREFPPIDGVQYLTPQPQHRIHAEVRTALCLFYPNFVYPETFGLVFAESKALGTPVLTHDCGAAAEIIEDPDQLLQTSLAERLYEGALNKFPSRWRSLPAVIAARAGLFDRYVERIRAWRAGGRPATTLNPKFRLSCVAQHWRSVLSE